MKKTTLVLIAFLWFACGSNELKKIPLSELSEGLKNVAGEIANDILYLTPKPDGIKKFIRKKYITTKVHVNINAGYYSLTGLLVSEKLGEVSSFKLFEVVDKGLIKYSDTESLVLTTTISLLNSG